MLARGIWDSVAVFLERILPVASQMSAQSRSSLMQRASLQACAEECENHTGHHEHCRICVETCRRCQTTCNNVLSEMGA